MEMSGQIHAPQALASEKGRRYTLNSKVNGSESRSGLLKNEKNLLAPVGIRSFNCTAYSIVTISAAEKILTKQH
jgi:hypothetical protein